MQCARTPRAVDRREKSPAGPAVRIHTALRHSTRCARDQNAVARAERGHARADGVDDASLRDQDPAVSPSALALQDVQVRPQIVVVVWGDGVRGAVMGRGCLPPSVRIMMAGELCGSPLHFGLRSGRRRRWRHPRRAGALGLPRRRAREPRHDELGGKFVHGVGSRVGTSGSTSLLRAAGRTGPRLATKRCRCGARLVSWVRS